jgi:hypothetical protein
MGSLRESRRPSLDIDGGGFIRIALEALANLQVVAEGNSRRSSPLGNIISSPLPVY